MSIGTWLRSIFGSKPKEPKKTRSTKAGESLTSWEDFFWSQFKRCPDCERGALRDGPEGPGFINVRCQECGARFNATALDHSPLYRMCDSPLHAKPTEESSSVSV